MGQQLTPAMVEALDMLRYAAQHSDEMSNRVARAFNVLDNADYFEALDEIREG